MPVRIQKTISFDAKDDAEGQRTLQALAGILTHLTADEIAEIAKVSQQKPGWVSKAKKWIHLL